MPTEKSAGGGAKSPPQFIKYRLSDEELETYQTSEVMVSDDVFVFVMDCVDQRLKFSVSHDNYGGGVQAFLTPSEADDPNYGYTLSARAPNLLSAIGLLRFKHENLFKGIWPKDQQPASGSRWG